MAAGWPTKANYATGDVLSATNMNDLSGTVNYLDPTSATDGQILTRDAASAGKVKWATASSGGSTNVAGKNGVLNSNFSVWQRGTSFTATSVYTADRWYRDGNTGHTFTRQTTSDTTNLPFIQYCLRAARDVASVSTTTIQIGQSFESVNSIPFAGKTVTFSFYARAGANYSPTSSALSYSVRTGTGTDQNLFSGYTGQALPINTTATLTTTWQRFSSSATLSASATELGVLFEATPTGVAGAADYFEVTGVQLEIASSASAYSPNTSTYQAELAACQRYYFKDSKCAVSDGYAQTATNIYSVYVYPTTMRTTPTLTQTGAATYSSNTAASTFTQDANGSNEIRSLIYFLAGASTGLTYLYRVVEFGAEL